MTDVDDSELLARPKATDRQRKAKQKQSAKQSDKRDQPRQSRDLLGRFMEGVARASGTPGFLLGLTVFVAIWLTWNTTAPTELRFDSSDLGFTVLTLALSLQASYAAPMILLAQNRQDDRDRVQIEQDRQRAERNTADLEYLMREIVALRMAMKDVASKDFIRAELRSLLEDIEELDEDPASDPEPTRTPPRPIRRNPEGDR
ncbi:DUF1003 domain-containing protein [Gulosibacter macacae]|uniref:DUF1003 domain-containing protein n=1 Tax=Gulosibacter macacae TaxID=2488791 RepID=A0A3P3W4L1_9MICO|nr:DUF1003 domain-containing protein [Gulosibacter macacae]RRJ88589.1 DUF1003 domain-containing protein [Gulosibacter macacae]